MVPSNDGESANRVEREYLAMLRQIVRAILGPRISRLRALCHICGAQLAGIDPKQPLLVSGLWHPDLPQGIALETSVALELPWAITMRALHPLLALIGLLLVTSVAVALLAVYAKLSTPWTNARAAARNKARSLRIKQTCSVQISEGIIRSNLPGNILESVIWSEVEEVGTTYRKIEREQIAGWLLKSPERECFVPFPADGEESLEKLIRALPNYYSQRSIFTEASQAKGRFVSLWRKCDPHPQIPIEERFDRGS